MLERNKIMKKSRIVVAVLALTLAVFVLPLTSQAAESAHYRFRGAFASASFFAGDDMRPKNCQLPM
jgi:hypothetical protein